MNGDELQTVSLENNQKRAVASSLLGLKQFWMELAQPC